MVRAAQHQIAVLNTNTRYLHDNIVEYALRLKDRLPEPLGVFFFAAEAAYIVERMKDKGILISTEGPRRNVLKIRPPLVIEEKDATRLIDTLDIVLDETPLKKPGTF